MIRPCPLIVCVLAALALPDTGEGRQLAAPDRDEVLDARRWSTYTEVTARGLRSVATASDTTIWFGTEDGLLHYDGLDWTAVDPSEKWQSAPVDVLLALKDGRLLTGSESGLGLVADGRWIPLLAPGIDFPIPIDGMDQAPDGSIWAASPWGAFHFTEQETVLHTSRDMAPAFPADSLGIRLQVVPDEVVPSRPWSSGLGFRIAQGAWYGLPRERSPVVIWAVKPGGPADRAGLKVGDLLTEVDGQASITRNRIKRPSETSVLLAVQRGAERMEVSLAGESLEGRVGDFHISDVSVAEDGTVWLAPYEGDVVRYVPGAQNAWTRFSQADGVGPGWSPRIETTSDGAVWLVSGASQTGVLRYDGRTWTETRLSRLGASDSNTDILETRDGTVWIGGASLTAYRDGGWKVYPADELPVSDHRTQLAESPDGALWVVGPGEWASRLDRESDRWVEFQGLVYQGEAAGIRWLLTADGQAVSEQGGELETHDALIDQVNSLLVSPDGTVWAGGMQDGAGGIARFEEGRWETLVHPALGPIGSTATLLDDEGYAWFGSSSGSLSGILRLSTDRMEWRRYLHPEAPPYVYGITQTEDGTIWTGGHQLYRKRTSWTGLSEPAALSAFVTDVAAGPDATLWVGSRFYGVLRLQEDSWDRFSTAEGLPAPRAEALLGLPDGHALVATPGGMARFDGDGWSPVLQGTFGDRMVLRGGLHMAPDGALWINTQDQDGGVAAVQYRPDQAPPRAEVLNREERIPWQRQVAIQWVGVDQWNDTPAGQIAFSHRIDQGEWSPFNTSTSAVLEFDGWGGHTVEVQARDGDFNVGSVAAVYDFTIAPPPWAQGRVLVPVGLLLLVIAGLVLRLASRKFDLDETNRQLAASNQEIEHFGRLQALLLDMTARLLVTDPEEVDAFVELSLEKLGREAGSDAAYLFRFTPDDQAFYNTHNWNSGQLRAVAFRERPMPIKLARWHIDQFLEGRPVVLRSLDELPREAASERRWIEIQQVSSMVNVPIVSLNKVVGFIGMASQSAERSWSDEEVAVLGVAGQLITAALDRTAARVRLEQLSESLEVSNAELEKRVRARTRELSLVNAQLEDRIAQGKELEIALLDATDRERRRLGADLHDGIAQSVAGARLLAASIAGESTDPNSVEPVLSGIDEMLAHTQREVGKLMAGYGLVGMDYRDLGSGLNSLVQELASRYTKVAFACHLQPDTRSITRDLDGSTHMLRIATEACTNAIKHGKPSVIDVSLRLEQGRLILEVTDNGTGLDGTGTEGWGYGMRIMQYRASRMGADLFVGDRAEGGVRVTCSLPVLTDVERPEMAPGGTA
ncbi:MAG: GAF domain-containing protein [Rhodothermales bacterium]|nr:GAF domain-containing protein [Rhodothermales bacterium]